MKKDWIRKMVVAAAVALALAGCGKTTEPKLADAAEAAEDRFGTAEVQALSEVSEELTVWSAYWDCADDIGVIRDQKERIGAVSLFAASFQDGAVQVPEATERMLKKIRRTNDTAVYLSVVNDVEQNGTSIQKDTEILKQVLGDETSAKDHAQTLVGLAEDGGYDGIEIDYEKIRLDLDLWEKFLEFEKILLEEAGKVGLKVRIVLEPGIPVEQLSFPEGPEYVVMCYNLYGGGTDPGPKADLEFLKEVYDKFHGISNISYALANGGYDWEQGSKKPTARTAEDIQSLVDTYHAAPKRSKDSGALSFSYTKKGVKHTVWYADETTLKTWAEELNRLSGTKVKISYWRL